MYTIGDLVKRFKIARSTILYYDKLGLLKPSVRGENNYRLYTEEEAEALERIIMFRDLGIPLSRIKEIVETQDSPTSEALIARLNKIQRELAQLKQQEELILGVLTQEVMVGKGPNFTKESWSQLLSQLGYKEEQMLEWHRQFEGDSPAEHYQFLKTLGMSEDEIQTLINIIN